MEVPRARAVELAVLGEQGAVLGAAGPPVDLAGAHDGERVAEGAVLGIAEVPSEGAAGGLVVAAGLLEEGVHVELVGKRRRPSRELHQGAHDRLGVLRHLMKGATRGTTRGREEASGSGMSSKGTAETTRDP